MQTLAHHILDILTNSAEACALFVDIQITQSVKKNFFSCKITDNGVGISKENLQYAGNKGFSTKQNKSSLPQKSQRGNGLYLLKEYCNKFDGNFSVTSQTSPPSFTETAFSVPLNKKNIKPIGDLAGVIIDFLYLNPMIELSLSYITDSGTFIFDSKQVKTILNSDFNNFTTVKLLKEYLETNIQSLQ